MGPGDIEQFDAVVVGGGPAGSTAALSLARLGWRVAVIERRPPGRSKACGCCLGPRGVRALERLGIAGDVLDGGRGAASMRVPTRRLRVHLPGMRPIEARLDRDGAGVVVDRAIFDDRLLEAAADAGVEVIRPASGRLDGLTVVEVVSRETGTRRLRGGLIVGADGLGSRVGKNGPGLISAAEMRPGPFFGPKVGFSIEAVAPRQGSGPEPGVIEMVVLDGGYVGAVRCGPGPGRVHVAGLIDLTHVRHRTPRDLLAAAEDILGFGICEPLARGEPLGLLGAAPMPWRAPAIVGPGVALVGDAAAYVEPFTGEGMGWALRSGELLAAAVPGSQSGPGIWEESAARMYERSWRREIGVRHRTCRFVAALIRRPGLVAACPGTVCRLAARWLSGRVMAA